MKNLNAQLFHDEESRAAEAIESESLNKVTGIAADGH